MRMIPFVYACFVVLAFAQPVAAATTSWNNNIGGSFTNAAKWTAGVPLVNDTAVFNRNLDIEYGVTFPGRPILSPLTREVRQLIVGANTVSFSDSVDFDQLPANFSIDAANTLAEGALIIGNTAGQVGELNTTLNNFSTSSVIVGNTELFPLTALGTLNVNGGTFNVTGSQELGDELIIGNEGNGLLYITGGADVNVTGGPHANSVIGRSSRELFGGLVSVDGAGSTLNISGELTLGEDGIGTISVQQGGKLTTGATLMGKLPMFGIGVSTVTGAGSTWTNNGDIVVGREGEAAIRVLSGGVATTSGSVFLGELSGSAGSATISGVGATWTIGGNLVVGNSGTGPSNGIRVLSGGSLSVAGLLTVASNGLIESNAKISADLVNGGTIDPGSDLSITAGALQLDGTYTQTAGGKLKFDLGGTLPATDYDQLLVSEAVSLNGTLEVRLHSPFMPIVGNAFNIIDGASISGTFNTLQLPTLPSGTSWNKSQLYTTGTLLVTIAGDFDADGDVDGGDFLLWQSGGSLNPFSANDLADWQNYYGAGPLVAISAAVPESSTWVLLALAAMGSGCTRRRRIAQ